MPARLRPGPAVLDVVGEGLLPRVEIDGRDPLSDIHQRGRDMHRGGGFSRAALFVAEHDDVRGLRIAAYSPAPTCAPPSASFLCGRGLWSMVRECFNDKFAYRSDATALLVSAPRNRSNVVHGSFSGPIGGPLPRIVRAAAGAPPPGRAVPRRRRDDRAGADHGRPACGSPDAGAAGAHSGRGASSSRSSSIPPNSGRTEDFASYPRDLASRCRAPRRRSTWSGRPTVETMYPPGFATQSCRKGRPRPASKTPSVRISSPASRPSSPSC